MKSLKLFLITGFLLLGLNLSHAQWEQVSTGIGNQFVNALAASGNYMFAGTELYGVYVSADNGTSWAQTTLTGINVLTFAVSGTNIFAGTYASGVYFSSDMGVSWSQTSLNNLRVTGLAIIGNTVFAGIANNPATSGVYFSNDNGTTWTRTTLQLYTVSVYADGNTLYAGTMDPTGDKLYRSNDLGATWTAILNKRIFSMYFGQGYMLAGYGGNNGGGISKSTDNGATWNVALNAVHTYALAGSNNYVFAATHYDGAYNSSDNGVTWDIRNEGLPVLPFGIQDLEFNNNNFYAATSSGIWKTPNNYFTLFYDYGMYTGMNNWVTNQGWGFSWAIPNGAFTDSPGKNYSVKNYSNNANNSMTLKNALNVSNYVSLKVSFTHKYLTEAGKDFCRVEVSSNNGTTWAEAKNYSGIVDTMKNDEVDITNLANKSANMKIRFRLTSDSRIVNDGWYVTNIRVIGKTSGGSFKDNIITNETPKKYFLGQNYPNPFNPNTDISYQLVVTSFVKLKVYDNLGREIKTLVEGQLNPGIYEVKFDGTNYPSGVYFYQLKTNEFVETKKMILLK